MHIKPFLLTLLFCLCVSPAWGASVYWVGGTDNWDATAGSKWSTSSGGSGGAAVPGASDTAIFDQTNTVCTITINTTVAQVTLTKGTLHTDGASDNSGLTHSWGAFSSSNSNTRALLLGNSTVNMTGGGSNEWLLTNSSGMTLTKGTSTINMSGAAATLRGGSQSYNTVAFDTNTTTECAVTGANTFVNLSKTGGSTTKNHDLVFYANQTITGTLTLNGNSAIYRLLVKSGTLGTQYTITTTGATVTATNTDFRDIALSVTKDFSAQTDIGDAGGNSGIIFPASTTQTITGSSANWSTASWTSRVPLPQDDVVISLTAGQTLTANMPRLGRNISFTTGTNFTLGNAVTSYGSLDFTGAGTLSGNFAWTFESNARTGNINLTSAGKTFAWGNTVSTQGAVLNLLDASAYAAGWGWTVSGGATLDTNGSTVTGSLTSTSTGTVNLNGSTWNINTSATGWNVGSTSTMNAGTSTIVEQNISYGTATFTGGGKNYNNLTVTGTGTGAMIFSDGNTFNTLTINKPKTVTFPASTTTTIAHLVADGDGSNAITINSSTGGTPATICTTLDQNLTYTNPTDISFTGATWECLTGCTPGTGVTGLNTSWTNRVRGAVKGPINHR